MRISIWQHVTRIVTVFFIAVILSNCAGSRYLETADIESEQSLKLYLRNGDIHEGIIVRKDNNEVTMINAADSKSQTISMAEIRRVERSREIYDYAAVPISNAEIERNKGNKNTWVYAAGGAAIGGLVGLAVGYPIWVANDNPPPLFVGGVTAVVSSIVFATKGIKRDKHDAIQRVRYLHSQNDLLNEKETQEKRLKALEEEKARLKKQLEEKKKQASENDG